MAQSTPKMMKMVQTLTVEKRSVASSFNCLNYPLNLPSVVCCCWLGSRKGVRPVKKTEWWGADMVICLERGADLHMAQLMPLPVTVSCFSKIQIGFSFLVPAHLGSPGQRAAKWVCVYRSTHVSWHLQSRTGGSCWCKVSLPACPC